MMLALCVAVAVFAGWNILRLFPRRGMRMSFWEEVFVSYGLGFGALSLEMLYFYFLGVRLSLLNILVPWVPLVAVNLFMFSRPRDVGARRGAALAPAGNNHAFLDAFFTAGIALEILYAFFRALIRPIEAYDAVTTYAIRSKIFFLTHSVPRDFFGDLSRLFPHPDYPLNIPLSETFVYLFLGGLNDQLVKVLFALFFTAILGIFYFAVRRSAGRTTARLFTFMLASVPQFNNFATNAYHDVPLAYYCFTGTLFLLYWLDDKNAAIALPLSAVMTALSAWTKNEGFVYCAANAALLAVFLIVDRRESSAVRRVATFASYLGTMLAVLAPWLWIKYSANLVNSDVGITTLDQLNPLRQAYRLWPIAYEFQRQLFGPKKWNMIWIAALMAAAAYREKIFYGKQRHITMSLALIISGYIAVYIVGRDEIRHMVGTTWSRMLIHFLPLCVYWLANLTKEDLDL